MYFENNIDLKHQKTYEIDLSDQMKGFYILRLINEDNVLTKSIIIQ